MLEKIARLGKHVIRQLNTDWLNITYFWTVLIFIKFIVKWTNHKSERKQRVLIMFIFVSIYEPKTRRLKKQVMQSIVHSPHFGWALQHYEVLCLFHENYTKCYIAGWGIQLFVKIWTYIHDLKISFLPIFANYP